MRVQGLFYFLLGLLLVLAGAIIPFLITLDVIKNNLWLCLFAYSASVLGLLIGMFGAIQLKRDELDG